MTFMFLDSKILFILSSSHVVKLHSFFFKKNDGQIYEYLAHDKPNMTC
jgi:hypothetical protein